MTKLTPELLCELGFRGEGRDCINRPSYRLAIPYNNKQFPNSYHWELQIVLANYGEDNPNSGILSLYERGTKDAHCLTWDKNIGQKDSKKIDFITNKDEQHIVGIKYITFPDRCFPIAWSVTTLERLNEIYTALTRNPPLKSVKRLKNR